MGTIEALKLFGELRRNLPAASHLGIQTGRMNMKEAAAYIQANPTPQYQGVPCKP